MARYILAIALLAVIAVPAFAQRSDGPPANPLAALDADKKKEAEAIDKKYKSMLKNTDQAATPVRVDPWQNMRGNGDAKAKQ